MDMGNRKTADFRTMQVIWFALMLSILIYLVVAYMVVSRGGGMSPTSETAGTIFPFLAGATALLLGVQTVIRRSISDERVLHRLTGAPRDGLPAGSATRDALRQALLQSHMTCNIILWALGEAPAVFGLVLTFLSGDLTYIAGFSAYSILNMAFHRPRSQAFEEQLRRLRRHVESRGGSA